MRITILMVCACVLFGCKSKSHTQNDDSELEFFKNCAKAQIEVEQLRKGKTPDYDIIEKKLEVCAPLIKWSDVNHRTTYEKDFKEALDKCKKGEAIKVNQQTYAKGLQHVVALKMRDLFFLMNSKNKKENMLLYEKVSALFEGIRPTFLRRDESFYGGKKTLEKEADELLLKMKTAAEKNISMTFLLKQFSDLINKTYALSVLYEVQQIEKKRDNDVAECDVKRAEAAIFYRVIEPFIKKRNEKLHAEIAAILKAQYTSFDAKKVQQQLNNGLGIMIQ